MKEHLTMQELEDLGFKIEKSRTMDNEEFIIQLRRKKNVFVETCWYDYEVYQQSVFIELEGLPPMFSANTLTKEELTKLDNVINKTI